MPRAWTSAARQPPPDKGEDPVTVLVTGFGPFLQKFPKNSSWEIASRLPALLPATPSSPTPIHIHVHHEAVRVAYYHVANFVPNFLPPKNPRYPEPDIILHIGLAAGRKFYTLEKGSHGRGYGAIPDVDGQKYPDSEGEARFPSKYFPPILQTSFDTADVIERWKANLGYSAPDCSPELEGRPDVRISPDAGNFMCGFIYYNSLAHYFSLDDTNRPVVFLHVPDLSDSQQQLEQGIEVAIELIKALVASKKNVGVVDGGMSVESVMAATKEQKVVADTDVNFA